MAKEKANEAEENSSDLINTIKDFLITNYETTQDPKDAEFHLSTSEVYNQLQKILPSKKYKPEDVAVWLHASGFKFYDFGYLCFEWLMKSKSV